MSKSDTISRPNSVAHTAATSAMIPNSHLLSPNTQVVVGTHRCEILEHLAEGGFANIYKVKFLELTNEMDAGIDSKLLKAGDIACLKRVIVPDENGLNELRNEVETMKQLRGSPNIVQYYDSNASRHPDGSPGFEILLLMELCPKKSLLDYMNNKLATKLTEAEILKIMYDVSNAIAQMHYLPTPLIHRDIKIENVLVDKDDNFKLCDFGSTSMCFPIVSTHQDIAVLTNNIYVHTTPQYRSPEMIDLYRCLPINEKSDIWALGIFLYKLLFYTTPFELTGQFAILHSKYEIPQNGYSSKLINLIIIMLAENPSLRPNIFQVMHHVCSILKCDVPFADKYELGPYDFAKYSQYHLKLQQIQYQMFELYKNEKVTSGDVDKLNDLFIQNFEIAPKQPIDKGVGSVDQQEAPEDLETDIAKMDECYPTVEKLESANAKEKDDNHLQILSTSLKQSSSRSVSDLSNKSQVSLDSNERHSSHGIRAPSPLPSSQQPQNTANMSAARQHKQHNPFQSQFQPEVDASDYFDANNEQYFKGTPPAHPKNEKNVSYFQQSPMKENNLNNLSIQQNDQARAFETTMPISDVPNNGNVVNDEYLIDISPPRSNVPYSTPAAITANMQDQVISSQPLSQSQSQSQSKPQPLPPPQPQVQVQAQAQAQAQASLRPERQQQIPAQPRLDLTFDQLDLSKNSLTRQSDTELEESIISDESISLDLKQPKLKEPVTQPRQTTSPGPESKEFLKPAKVPKRRSLDLKYQEINLSNDDQRKHRKNKTSFSRTSVRRSVEMERMKHDSNSTSNSNARDETKETKRRSFFGVFK
ncbi:Akl1 [Kluyveromyces lactis]|nr:Akl1 [Kluyveromyces lactis]